MQDQAAEAAVAAAAHKVTTAGAGTVVVGYLTLNDLCLVVGVIVTVAGFVVNLYYKRKQDRREAQLQEARIAALRAHGQHE
jgi:uncharacterized protein involved in propanediol utilization